MNKAVLIALNLLLTTFSYSQNNQIDSTLKVLDAYMNAHIPDMNSGVSKFENTLSEGTLTKETFVFDGDNHSKEFELKNAEIKVEKLKVDREAAKVYGYKYYWEVSIGEAWFLSSIEDPKVAERLAGILTDLKSLLE